MNVLCVDSDVGMVVLPLISGALRVDWVRCSASTLLIISPFKGSAKVKSSQRDMWLRKECVWCWGGGMVLADGLGQRETYTRGKTQPYTPAHSSTFHMLATDLTLPLGINKREHQRICHRKSN